MSKHWLTNCAWVDENDALHIDVPRMLKELKVPDTPENRHAAQKMATEILIELLKDHPAVIKTTE